MTLGTRENHFNKLNSKFLRSGGLNKVHNLLSEGLAAVFLKSYEDLRFTGASNFTIMK